MYTIQSDRTSLIIMKVSETIGEKYGTGWAVILVHERDDLDGEVKSKYYVKISSYLIEKSSLGIGMVGQPKPQYNFHRPVSTILMCFFESGFVLDAYEEPSFTNIEDSNSIYDNVFKHIPPALVCGLRIPDSTK